MPKRKRVSKKNVAKKTKPNPLDSENTSDTVESSSLNQEANLETQSNQEEVVVASTSHERDRDEEFVFAPFIESDTTGDGVNRSGLEASEQESGNKEKHIEIIDVDKLPDRPDSPIGDDVIEIKSIPAKVICRSQASVLRAGVVDLTDDDFSIPSVTDEPAVVTEERASSSSRTKNDSLSSHTKINRSSSTSNSAVVSEQSTSGQHIASTGTTATAVATDTTSTTGALSSNEVEEDLPDVSRILTPSLSEGSQQKKSKGSSSPSKMVSCPICMDNAKEIAEQEGQLVSTYCGHVFCKACVTRAIDTQGKCPKCRKKLTKKKIHPLFI